MLKEACFKLTQKELNDIDNEHYNTDIYLNKLEIGVYGYVGPVSLITGLFLIYFYITRSALRKPPGMLIFWQCIAQTCMDINWTYTGVNYYYM